MNQKLQADIKSPILLITTFKCNFSVAVFNKVIKHTTFLRSIILGVFHE